jgi:hypothetical protein
LGHCEISVPRTYRCESLLLGLGQLGNGSYHGLGSGALRVDPKVESAVGLKDRPVRSGPSNRVQARWAGEDCRLELNIRPSDTKISYIQSAQSQAARRLETGCSACL